MISVIIAKGTTTIKAIKKTSDVIFAFVVSFIEIIFSVRSRISPAIINSKILSLDAIFIINIITKFLDETKQPKTPNKGVLVALRLVAVSASAKSSASASSASVKSWFVGKRPCFVYDQFASV